MKESTTYFMTAEKAAEVFNVAEGEAVKLMEQHEVPSTALGFIKVEKYYDFKVAARILGTSHTTLKRRVHEWGMNLYKPGRAYKWTQADIDEFKERSLSVPK